MTRDYLSDFVQCFKACDALSHLFSGWRGLFLGHPVVAEKKRDILLQRGGAIHSWVPKRENPRLITTRLQRLFNSPIHKVEILKTEEM